VSGKSCFRVSALPLATEAASLIEQETSSKPKKKHKDVNLSDF
jgi:hypothetical protein